MEFCKLILSCFNMLVNTFESVFANTVFSEADPEFKERTAVNIPDEQKLEIFFTKSMHI